MGTRNDIINQITSTKISLKNKNIQIQDAKRKLDFKGLTIKSQLNLGSSKRSHKNFRREAKRNKRQAISDLPLFDSQSLGLRNDLLAAEDDLFVFDNMKIGEGII